MKSSFFLGKLYQNFFCFRIYHGILHTEFGLIWTSLTRWKRPIFKIRYSRNSQNSVWKPNFFHASYTKKSNSRYPWDILYRVWFDLNNSYSLPRKKVSFSYGNLRNSRILNFKNRSFSSGQASYTKTFFFVLHSIYTWDSPYRVWYENISLTRWKRPIFKIRYSRNSQISVWKTNFFPRQAIEKILSILQSKYTVNTP